MRISIILLAAGTLAAQHSYTTADIQDGARLYTNACVICHGPNGDQIPGINLIQGKFRRATNDASLIAIIQNGIPAAGMPGNSFTEFQAGTIVAYLRSLAAESASALAAGDPARGKTIFEGKGACQTCHSVRNTGSIAGPDLTDIGLIRRPRQLEASILDPDAEILPQNRTYRVVTREGTSITGRLLNQDPFSVQLIDAQGLRSFQKVNLREHGFVSKSPMPSYKGKLTDQEVADLVSYLLSLKGIGQP